MNKFLAFLLMLLLVISASQAARPLSALSVQQRYSKIFATLGVVCKCCDGSGGECSSTWTQPCSQPHLKCLPWKLH
ncbi:Proteasome inhibitor-related [Gossypium australe]|uniref:Proteasome inhibitor-related n=1 Tax=Gossypium australe TaxID=47621 RepID=A0A5B6V467_9ROSI|nr:Proteasome inhibitor-related [Gossypium australe]